MAFDVLSRPGAVPAIFGDADDIGALVTVTVTQQPFSVVLVFEEDGQFSQIPLSSESAQNMKQATDILAVGVDESGETDCAFMISLEQNRDERRPIDAGAIDTIMSAYDSGGFCLEHLQRAAS